MKKVTTLIIFALVGTILNAQNVNIPDTNFKNALLAHGASAPVNGVNPITGFGISLIDANNDGDISTTEAQNYTGTINVGSKSISDLTGIEAFVNITILYCHTNQLTSVDVSANTALTDLYCNHNQLTSLDVSNNTNLTGLGCGSNVLNTLDVSANISLLELACENNQMNSLDVSANTALTALYCNNNQLTSLDVSANTALKELYCYLNQLTSLNVANGNNGTSSTDLSQVIANNNPNLTCIQHDTGFDPTTTLDWSKDATASWSTNCSGSSCANIVNIPDANFKNALLAHGTSITGAGISTIDTDGDGEICQTEAQAYTGVINVSSKSISDLTGIETFVNATELYCSSNQLNSLDVSANTALTELYCTNNQLTSLNVSGNTALIHLYCYSNNLTNLDVSTNTALTRLSCSYNQLSSLDVSASTNLTHLSCGNNALSTLDVSVNTALRQLACTYNQITSLDVSANTALTQLYCQSNQLNSLNVANGNNGNITVVNATSNPNLTCIQHDTGFDPTTVSGWQKDATASWSDNCGGGSTCTNIVNIPDANFKNALLAHGTSITGTGISVIDTDGDGEICNTEAQAYTGKIDVYNKNISDLTGIEAFVNLTKLYCQNNQLTSVDVSANTALTELYCYSNQLSSLDVSTNTALVFLYCENNQIGSLDVSSNTALTTIYCNDNQITSLDVSANTALTRLYCYNNQLTSLNVANGNNGTSSMNLSEVIAINNPNLTCIQHDTGFAPTTANWQKDATATWSNDCSGSININNIAFENLKVYPNPAKDILYIEVQEKLDAIQLIDLSGKVVKTFKGENKQLDIANITKGVYFLEIINTNKKSVIKVSISN